MAARSVSSSSQAYVPSKPPQALCAQGRMQSPPTLKGAHTFHPS